MSERDNQRKKVYDWENKLFAKDKTNQHIISYQECYDIANQVCNDLNVLTPPFVAPGKVKYPVCEYEFRTKRTQIKIPHLARTKWVVLHEVAHSIVYQKYGVETAGHGKKYMTIYINLLHKYMGVSINHLRLTAYLDGLAFSKTEDEND
jgi:hypothetical protein